MSEENVAVVYRLAETYNRGDLQSFSALFAPDAEIVPLRAEIESTIYRGPRAPQEFFDATQEAWESASLEIEEIRGGGDCLVALGRFRALGRASGATIDAKPGWVMRFRDGAITSAHSFADRADALRAAGLPE